MISHRPVSEARLIGDPSMIVGSGQHLFDTMVTALFGMKVVCGKRTAFLSLSQGWKSQMASMHATRAITGNALIQPIYSLALGNRTLMIWCRSVGTGLII